MRLRAPARETCEHPYSRKAPCHVSALLPVVELDRHAVVVDFQHRGGDPRRAEPRFQLRARSNRDLVGRGERQCEPYNGAPLTSARRSSRAGAMPLVLFLPQAPASGWTWTPFSLRFAPPL